MTFECELLAAKSLSCFSSPGAHIRTCHSDIEPLGVSE